MGYAFLVSSNHFLKGREGVMAVPPLVEEAGCGEGLALAYVLKLTRVWDAWWVMLIRR